MRIVVAGAGVTGRRLVGQLVTGRHDLVVIDLNRELCEAVSAEYGVPALSGNATDIATLEQAELHRADVAVALMRASADNLAFALLARGAGVKRIIARMPNPKYRAAYESAGVTSILDVAGLFLDRLVFEIERPPVQQVAALEGGQGAVVWITVGKGSSGAGRPLEELRQDRRFPHGCVVAGLIRENTDRLLFPTARDRLLPGDRVLLVGTIAGLTKAADLFGERHGLSALFHRTRPSAIDREEQAQARLDASQDDAAEREEQPEDEGTTTEP